LVIDDPDFVQEAVRLFYADARRQEYQPAIKNFLVSPANSREQLSHFIRGAEKQLLIYDPEISDRAMIRLLRDRAREGVEIRIIGRVKKPSEEFDAGRLMRMRFHTRAILRDRRDAFLGSQSLREAELDRRRELGVVVHDRDAVHALVKVFDSDWAGLAPARHGLRTANSQGGDGLKKAVKAIVRDLPLAPIVEDALRHAVGQAPKLELRGNELRHDLTDVLKQAVEDAVSGIVRRRSAHA
jgi:phosphatidylserine/phosphatidylglycerophosphate/cardiolipin synthase-like enzyme